MSWFDTALEMVTRTPLEVTVKNTVAQLLKEFYGYGPRVGVRCQIHGPLILYDAPLAGSASLEDLAAHPAGHVVMHFSNGLLMERYRERLGALSRLALQAKLAALFCDFDPASRRIVAGALLSRPLNRDHRPAEPGVASAVRAAVAAMGGPAVAEVAGGPGAFWTRLPAAGWAPAVAPDGPEGPGGPNAAATLAAMARWRAWRDELAGRLRAACAAAGRESGAVFAGADRGTLVLGGLWPPG